jgi:hypothetical protein
MTTATAGSTVELAAGATMLARQLRYIRASVADLARGYPADVQADWADRLTWTFDLMLTLAEDVARKLRGGAAPSAVAKQAGLLAYGLGHALGHAEDYTKDYLGAPSWPTRSCDEARDSACDIAGSVRCA